MFRLYERNSWLVVFVASAVSCLLAFLALSGALSNSAQALTTTPTTMNFQGRLADSTGQIMPDGLYNMQFALYTVSSGGSSVWSETRENNGTDYRVQVTNGLFSTKLGEASPLSASLFASGPLYFQITMATPATANCSTASCASWESPMSPRHQMSTSAYAYNAETLDGLDSAAFGQLSAANTWTNTNSIQLNSATAFQVQNASGTSLFTADTSSMAVSLGERDIANGYTDVFNTSNSGGYNGMQAVKFTASASGTMSAIRVYFRDTDGSPNDQFEVALYTDGAACGTLSSCPGTKIAESSSATVTDWGWAEAAISASVTSGTSYWLAVNNNGVSTNDTAYATGTGSDSYVFVSQTFGTWPSTFTAPTYTGNAKVSIFAKISSTGTKAFATNSSGSIAIGASAPDSQYQLLVDGASNGNAALKLVGKQDIAVDNMYALSVTNAAETFHPLVVDTVNNRLNINVDPSYGWADAALNVLQTAGTANILRLSNNGSMTQFTVTAAGDVKLGNDSDKTLYVDQSESGAGYDLTVAAGQGDTGQIGGDLLLMAGANGTASGTPGSVIVRASGGDTTTGFQVQNAASTPLFTVDTTNTAIAIAADTTLATGKTLRITGDVTGNRPAATTAGQFYYDTTTNEMLVSNGTKWVSDRSTATVILAANDSPQQVKDAANYVVDGTSDETEINAALSAAAGGTVFLAEGTYTADGTILVPNNTTLAGTGRGTVVKLDVGSGTDNLIEATGTDRTGQIVRDLSLDGSAGTGGTQHGIYFTTVGQGSGTGVSARQGGKIINVFAYYFQGRGIALNGSDNNTISGNVSEDNTTTGIFLFDSLNNTITGNHTQGNFYGIYLNSSLSNTISSNTSEGNTSQGIILVNSSDGNTISSNTVSGTGTDSGENIYIEDSANNTVTGNTVSGSTNSAGIWLYTATYTTVTGNNVSGNVYAGIVLSNSSNNNLISGNKLHNNGGATTNNGIYLSASDANTITNNDITDTSATTNNYAINIFDNTSDNNYLADNRFSSTPGTATINDADTGTVYANQATGENGTKLTNRTANDTAAFSIQNANGVSILNVDSTNGELEVGSYNGGTNPVAGKIVVADSASAYTATLQAAALTSDQILTLPNLSGTLCVKGGSNTCSASAYTKIVAASDSPQAIKDTADYVADGTDDQVEINAALTAAAGGKVYLAEGTYTTHRTDSGDATIKIPNNTTLAGAGTGTVIQLGDIDVTDNLIESSDTSTGTGVVIRDLKIDGQSNLNTVGTQHGIYMLAMGGAITDITRQGAIVENVTITRFRNDGIQLDTSGQSRISHVNSYSNGNYGIYLTATHRTTIENSLAQANTGSNIRLNSGSTSNTITGNTARDSTNSSGIKIDGSSNDNAITGNATASNSSGYSISNSTHNTLTGNTSFDDDLYGVWLSGDANYNVISSNNITDSGSATNNNAVYIDASDSNTITNNGIYDSSCTSTCYAVNIINSTANKNYFSNNRFSSTPTTSTIRDSAGASSDNVYVSQPWAEDGSQIINRTANSSSAFSIQRASGASLFLVDTSAARVDVSSSYLRITGTSSSNVALQLNSADLTLKSSISSSQYSIQNQAGFDLSTVTGGTLTNLYGMNNIAEITVAPSTGVTNAFGEYVRLDNTANAAITNVYGLRVANSTGTAPTNAYGVFVERVSGSSTSFPLYLADNSTTPTPLLSVDKEGVTVFRTRTNSATGFQVQKSSNAAVLTVDTSGGNILIDATTQYTQRLCHSGANAAAQNDVTLGDCNSTGQADLAEMYEVVGAAEPGDVVAPKGSYKVGVTSSIYQSDAIGIISTNPIADGIIGYNADEATRQPVGLAGRVPVKLSLENGPIKAGDYLTTSSTPGFAMKATAAGRVIGVALEDFDSSTSPRVSILVTAEEVARDTVHDGELPRYRSNPDNWPENTGKIMAFINPTFYAPPMSDMLQGSSLTIDGDALVDGGLAVGGGLNVSGATNITSLNVSDDAVFEGKITVHTLEVKTGIIVGGHIVSKGAAPEVDPGTALGVGVEGDETSGPTVTNDGTDSAGTVTVKTGAEQVAEGVLAHLTFAEAYESGFKVVVGANNEIAAGLRVYTVKTDAGFDIVTRDALSADTEYVFDYLVLGVDN